jgi:phage-related protein
MRIKAGNGIYRVFCFFDEGNLVILLGGFQKKTDKTPRREINTNRDLKLLNLEYCFKKQERKRK